MLLYYEELTPYGFTSRIVAIPTISPQEDILDKLIDAQEMLYEQKNDNNK